MSITRLRIFHACDVRGSRTHTSEKIVAAPIASQFAMLVRFLVIVALVVCLFNACVIATHIYQNSDTVQGLLTGNSVASGNLLLSGWHLAPDNFLFTDTLPYAGFELFLGPRAKLIPLVPALTYTLIAFAALLACIRPSRPAAQNLAGAAVILLVLGIPPYIGHWDPILLSNHHLGTVLGALVALMICARLATGQRRTSISAVAAFVLVGIATIASDPFSLAFCFFPSLLVLATDLVLQRGNLQRQRLVAAIGLTLAIGLGILLPHAILWSGGFVTDPSGLVLGFATPSQMGRNLEAVACGLLKFFGAKPFAPEIGFIDRSAALMRCAVIALIVLAMLRAIWQVIVGKAHLFDWMLTASILAVLPICVVSQQFALGVVGADVWQTPSQRYLTPVVFFSAVLAGRQLPQLFASLPTRSARITSSVLLALLSASILTLYCKQITNLAATPDFISKSPSRQVGLWLEQHGLNQGVGGYWSASIVTAMTDGAVKVSPVMCLKNKLVPFLWATDDRWYGQHPQFVIWYYQGDPSGLNLDVVRATYGRVDRLIDVDGYRVAVISRKR